MNTKIVKLEHQVNCDLCGQPIHVGDKCKIITDRITGKAYFEHMRCPGADMPITKYKPIFPTLTNAHMLVLA
jgi:hypothetical protein